MRRLGKTGLGKKKITSPDGMKLIERGKVETTLSGLLWSQSLPSGLSEFGLESSGLNLLQRQLSRGELSRTSPGGQEATGLTFFLTLHPREGAGLMSCVT